jgi:hypothetical protein
VVAPHRDPPVAWVQVCGCHKAEAARQLLQGREQGGRASLARQLVVQVDCKHTAAAAAAAAMLNATAIWRLSYRDAVNSNLWLPTQQ